MMTLEERSELNQLTRKLEKIQRQRARWFDLLQHRTHALEKTSDLLLDTELSDADTFYRLRDLVLGLVFADYNWFIRTVMLTRFKERDEAEWLVIDKLYELHSNAIDAANQAVKEAIQVDCFYKRFGDSRQLLLGHTE